MHKALAEFELEDGSTFLMQVQEPEDDSALERVADTEQVVYKAQQKFEKVLDKVQPVAAAVLSRLKAGLTEPADEVELKFGLNLSADANVIFSTIGSEVNFEITLKWSKDKSNGSESLNG